ncbi:MAG: two-component system response regulator [Elusimicrobia bacterium CG08_land_8_20_14_0_20_51_18]|nr:MAG: two-component system response regulator [Elusimicrobia bacterium CG08_land_8_20_14_0_20_51_18]
MTHRILLADDDAVMLDLVSSMLKNEGYEVLEAENGKEAVELASRMLPSLIMLDMHMPEKNGLETLKEMKKNKLLRNVPVVMLTVEGSPSEIELCMVNGANTYITKPAKKEEIIKVVKDLLI